MTVRFWSLSGIEARNSITDATILSAAETHNGASRMLFIQQMANIFYPAAAIQQFESGISAQVSPKQ